MNSFIFCKVGSLMAGGGVIWAVYVATQNASMGPDAMPSAAGRVISQAGPLEVCGVGVLLWLLGKWRGSVRQR